MKPKNAGEYFVRSINSDGMLAAVFEFRPYDRARLVAEFTDIREAQEFVALANEAIRRGAALRDRAAEINYDAEMRSYGDREAPAPREAYDIDPSNV